MKPSACWPFLCIPSPCTLAHGQSSWEDRQVEEEVSEPGFLPRNVIECKYIFSSIQCDIHSEMRIIKTENVDFGNLVEESFILGDSNSPVLGPSKIVVEIGRIG